MHQCRVRPGSSPQDRTERAFSKLEILGARIGQSHSSQTEFNSRSLPGSSDDLQQLTVIEGTMTVQGPKRPVQCLSS